MYKTTNHTKADTAPLAAPLAALASGQLESPGFAPTALLRAVLAHCDGGYVQTIGDDTLSAAIALKPRAWPLPITESWITPITSSGLPVLARADARAALKALLDAQRRPLLLRELPVASKAYELLHGEAAHAAVLTRWERACVSTVGSYGDWFDSNFDHKRRKEFKRLRARLGEMGELKTDSLEAGQDVVHYIDNLLKLEAAGWKGQRGTALAQDPHLESALRDGLAELHTHGRLRFWQMSLGGKAIASLFAVVENSQATLGKIAYDEAYAKYSPGVLTVLDATAAMFADPLLHFADSNAIPDHPMINRIWRERHVFEDIIVAPASISSARFAATVSAERLRLSARTSAKALYHRLRRSS